MMKHAILWILIGIVLAGCGEKTTPEYVAEVDAWHSGRVERLRSDTGWLTLIGLHPLSRGMNTLGSGPDATVNLGAKAPTWLGDIAVDDNSAMLAVAPNEVVTLFGAEDGSPVSHLIMATDAEGQPTMLAAGSLVFYVIDRQGYLYLRVKDREAEALKTFTGIDRYPVEAKWRVKAKLEGEPSTLRVPNVLGQVDDAATPGTLVFKLDGKKCRLTPTGDAGESMFLVFGDKTNGMETYPGGRFLVIEAPDADGVVWVDFNRAYNPPCVFSAFATCPLPTAENRLDLPVKAGEKKWGSADH
jgi:uncharacterized protein (DUF1684 family)